MREHVVANFFKATPFVFAIQRLTATRHLEYRLCGILRAARRVDICDVNLLAKLKGQLPWENDIDDQQSACNIRTDSAPFWLDLGQDPFASHGVLLGTHRCVRRSVAP
jgi:hypothetical protein